MKLGENLEVALAVKHLPTSLAFFKTLGFTQFGEPYTEPHPWMVISDGDIHLGLHEYDEPSPALVYFTNDFQARVDYVKELGIPIINQMEMEGKLIMIAFRDPNGQGLGIVDLMGAKIEMPTVENGAKIGEFGEFSIPTKDLKTSVAFYEQFGFEGETYEEPYPWAILRDGLFIIGLHQTPDFKESTITYFDKNMPAIIKWVKSQGIEPMFSNQNEKGDTHEIGIRSPDGQPMFLFNW